MREVVDGAGKNGAAKNDDAEKVLAVRAAMMLKKQECERVRVATVKC